MKARIPKHREFLISFPEDMDQDKKCAKMIDEAIAKFC